MSEADVLFKWLVTLTIPVAVLYPLVYGTSVRWWESSIGRALLIKALGLLMLLLFSVFFYWFGPGYFGRDTFRIGGMSLLFVGLHLAFIAMVREIRRGRRTRTP